ncbi:hypothetical protein L1887_16324 [Cichorium endivia]|nr:hypothetical protein L1887_16324 [Cichorium endivia]
MAAAAPYLYLKRICTAETALISSEFSVPTPLEKGSIPNHNSARGKRLEVTRSENARCTIFRQRLYNNTGNRKPDFSLDKSYAAKLRPELPIWENKRDSRLWSAPTQWRE